MTKHTPPRPEPDRQPPSGGGLLPCPFCNSPKLTAMLNTVICDKCSASGPDLGETRGKPLGASAKEAWNTRANPPTEPVAWRYRLKGDWKVTTDDPANWPNSYLREHGEIEPLYATPMPEGDFVLVSREKLKAAIRTYCNSQSAESCCISSDGVERIYYAGLSVDGLVEAVIAAARDRK